jgi:hypothetical protein
MTIGRIVAIHAHVHFIILSRNLGLSVLRRTYEPQTRVFCCAAT